MLDQLKKDERFLTRPGKSIDFGEEKWGFLLFNMGGPEKKEDVREFLYNVFSDPAIIRLPLSDIFQKPLARFIARRRSAKVAKRYQAIGGGSPLLKWTRLVASGVKRELSKQYPQVEAFVGMRYFEPYIGDELNAAVDEGCRHLVLVSMYPHYCQATTGTALMRAAEWLEDSEADVTVSAIEEWFDRPRYIDLIRKRIDDALEKIGSDRAKIIFSAHSIPQRLADSGDPYVGQVRATVAAAGEGYDHILTFQSRTGPVRWVGPDTLATVRRLARQGVREMVVVPISFVSDHIETLYEIDIEIRQVAQASGVEKFVRTESLNDDPRYIEFLADLVEEKINPED